MIREGRMDIREDCWEGLDTGRESEEFRALGRP